MSPLQEKKILRWTLSRIDHAPRALATVRSRLVLSWIMLVLLLLLAMSIAPLIPLMATAIIFFGLGALGIYVYIRIVSARGWSILQRYLDRPAMEAQLNKLGA